MAAKTPRSRWSGELDERDPAIIAAERAAEVKKLIEQAKQLDSNHSSQAVLASTYLRVKAICVHLHIE